MPAGYRERDSPAVSTVAATIVPADHPVSWARSSVNYRSPVGAFSPNSELICVPAARLLVVVCVGLAFISIMTEVRGDQNIITGAAIPAHAASTEAVI